jgi:SPX domain-containing protein involved in vacuolar polyphosphate accumulation
LNNVKYRHELKFLLNPGHAEILKKRLALVMKVDDNSSNDDNTYFIRSLYFDDIKDSAYYEKIDGTEQRKKYRIRIYNFDDSFIRLERKDKNRNLTHKEQTAISKEVCLDLIEGKYDDELLLREDLLGELVREMKTKRLVPTVIVDYKRLAYTFPVEDTRVTFDEEIKSGRFNYNLFDKDFLSYDIFDTNETVLEVKFNNVIPKHIANIIMSIPTVRQAISKFALCREKKEV